MKRRHVSEPRTFQQGSRRPTFRQKKKAPRVLNPFPLVPGLSFFFLAATFFFVGGTRRRGFHPSLFARQLPSKKQPRRPKMAYRQPPQVYWEPQEDLRCGRHAINMICGRRAFSTNDVDQMARDVDFQCGATAASLKGLPGEASANYVPCATGGNWDADVLLKTLNSQPAFAVAAFSKQQMPPPEAYAKSYVGTLIHKTAKASRKTNISSSAAAAPTDRLEASTGHYTCFRKLGAALYHLDSLNEASAYCAVPLEEAQRRIQQPGVNSWHVFRNISPGNPRAQHSSGSKTPQPAEKTGPPPETGAASSSHQPRASPVQRAARRTQFDANLDEAANATSSYPGPPTCSAPDCAPARTGRSAHSLPSRANRKRTHSVAQPRRKISPPAPAGPGATSHENPAAGDPGKRAPKKAKTSDDAKSNMENLPFSKYSAADVTNLLRRYPLDVVRQSIAEVLGPLKRTTFPPEVQRTAIPQDRSGGSVVPPQITQEAPSVQTRAPLSQRRIGKTGKLAPTNGGNANDGERIPTPGKPAIITQEKRRGRAALRGPDAHAPEQPTILAASGSARMPGRAKKGANVRKSKPCNGGWYPRDFCVFSRRRPGQPARPRRNRLTCFWCSGRLAKSRLPKRTRGNYRKTFRSFSPHVQQRAISRMHARVREYFTALAPKRVSQKRQAPPRTLVLRRPANTLDCPGSADGSECFFSATDSGEPALLRLDSRVCWWCSLAELALPDSQDGQTSRPSAALESAIQHVFNNFTTSVQRLARLQASATVRSIINKTRRRLCRGQRFDAPCEFSTLQPGCAVQVFRDRRCACCRADFAQRLLSRATFLKNVRQRTYRLLQPAYQSKLMRRVPAELRGKMAAGAPTSTGLAPPAPVGLRFSADKARPSL